jgi:hypothetical protein
MVERLTPKLPHIARPSIGKKHGLDLRVEAVETLTLLRREAQ